MDTKSLDAVSLTVRSLSMDAIQKANSGHPGLPLGCAEFGALLYSEVLNHNPKDPEWLNRDRFVLSAGHGSMFLYSLLHLSGYDLSLEDIKKFRQLGSKTPGHPERGVTPGVEVSTGPLGQGIANSVGMAMAQRKLAAHFNTDKHKIIDHHIYVLAGDGCVMEGVAAEAASLAGHHKLGQLVVVYDANRTTIDGSTDITFTENVGQRFESYGWQVLEGDAYDYQNMYDRIEEAKKETGKPTIIIMTSIIGKGSPNKENSNSVHGAPLGVDEVVATKKNLGLKDSEDFFVHPDATALFEAKQVVWTETYDKWNTLFEEWKTENPELAEEFSTWCSTCAISIDDELLPTYNVGDQLATRKAGSNMIKAIAKTIPNFFGGSADLGCSNLTDMPEYGDFTPENPKGRTIRFGVREHAMGAMINGIITYGGLKAFSATFLVFADYMHPPIRMAALMQIPSIFVFTHDSIYVGEDGPTHQPIEQLAVLRAIPNTLVLRPGDAEETEMAWKMALGQTDRPPIIVLTRQNLRVYEKPADWKDRIRKGAYVVKDCDNPEVVIVATGSEVNVALEAAELSDKKIRVVSMISRELFLAQDKAFRNSLTPEGVRVVTCEAGRSLGWERIATTYEDIHSIDQFGEAGPGKVVAEHLGMDANGLLKIINR